jgi:hypothetical protein
MKTKLKRWARAREVLPWKRCKKRRSWVASIKDRQLRKTILSELRPGLERDTFLMPWVIAESVCAEVARFLETDMPERYAVWLEAQAELCYARRGRFRNHMREGGDAPREWLYSFMRHWLWSLLEIEHPDLCRCLPKDFSIGLRLPPGTHPRANSVGGEWDPLRVTGRPPWAWLARRGMADVAERLDGGGPPMEKLIAQLYGRIEKKAIC